MVLTVIGGFFLGMLLVILIILIFWFLAFMNYQPFVVAYNNTFGYGIWSKS